MRALNQVPIAAEIIGGDHWPTMRGHLFDVLSETDEQLSALSLKFISHAFSTTNPQTKEIYTLLVENLTLQMQSRWDQPVMLLQNGLNTSAPDMVKILKMFRLMNKFQHEAPNYWVRYPEKFLNEVLEGSLKLICSVKRYSSSGQQLLEPLHLLALLDCKATWFSKWMHGIYSRAPLLKLLKNYQHLVNNSVRSVLDFVESRRAQKERKTQTPRPFDIILSDYPRSLQYTSDQLEYALLIHSICLLGRLLMFKCGRQLFPIHILDMLISVNVTQLLMFMCNLIVSPVCTYDIPLVVDSLDPASLATEVLVNLSSKEDVCAVCLCKDAVTDRLILPVSRWLDFYKANNRPQSVNENAIVQVTDVLCQMASTSCGRKHLLYGEDRDLLSKSKCTVAHQLAEFTSVCLKNTGSDKLNWPSRKVISETLYVCRLLYSTCEGLHVLKDYQLHITIKHAWKEACLEAENATTPVPADSDSDESCSSSNNSDNCVSSWELTLQDSLLSVASTARGVLLIRQIDLLDECVAFLNRRYEKGLQVSKCEKFGYGTLISAIAGTAPGVTALKTTGFIKNLLEDTWSVLECGISDVPPLNPKIWNTDALDRTCHKELRHLMTLLYCSHGVCELLSGEKLPNKDHYDFREIPTTLVELLDRLVIVDSPAKIHSLFNYEESHVFGLRVLSGLICSLDTCLLLQAQYQFQELFLKEQASCTLDDSSNSIILDMLSLERNYILVQSYLIGGPTERCLPTRTLQQSSDKPYHYPLFSKYPVPTAYTPVVSKWTISKPDTKMMKMLSCQKINLNQKWIAEMRSVYSNLLMTRPQQLQGSVAQLLLEQTVLAMVDSTPAAAIFPSTSSGGMDAILKRTSLCPLQRQGLQMTVRYGETLGLLSGSIDHAGRLCHLLRQSSAFLQQQQQQLVNRKHSDYKLKFLQDQYEGFDWFVATVFLVFQGNKDRAWKLLTKFSRLAVSGFLWPARLHLSIHLPAGQVTSGIPLLYSTTAHYVDFLLQIELPLVASAFTMSGFSSVQICQQWLLQCFWNYLDWPDIVHYICMCCVLGADYQVYVCVAILRHLQADITAHAQLHDLSLFLKEEPIRGFHIRDHLSYMKELEVKHRKMLQPEMYL